jgi:Transposase DDE domain
MATPKRSPRTTPPSQRPERDQPAARQLPDWPEQVLGGKHLRALEHLVQELRDSDPHGNRDLFLDDVFIASLLAFFNPSLRSLRTIEDFSQTRQAQKHLSIPKLCKSTFSDFNKLADPTRLRPILDQLRRETLKPGAGTPTHALDDLHRQVLAVDGTFLKAAADVAWAFRKGNQTSTKKRGARLDFHVDVNTWLPEVVVVAQTGESEADNARGTITPGAIHLYDRGIFSFELINAHTEAKADFVMRIREEGERCPKFEATETRELTAAARAAGVVSDRLGRLTGSAHRRAPDRLLREVIIIPPDDPDHPVRLLTTLLDLDALTIGLLYRHRWQIELFFRWLKCYARFDHLLSHSREGVLLNFYVAVVGVTLMYLHTGYRPSKYLFSLMGLVANGSATLEEILPILRERERQSQMQRDRVARKRAEKSR